MPLSGYSRLIRIFSNNGSSIKSVRSLPSAKLVLNHSKEPKSKDWKKVEELIEKYKNLSHFEGFIVHSLIDEFLQSPKAHIDITNETFAAKLIGLYGKAGMFDHARKLFDEMPDLQCERTVLSLNALLAACVSCKEFHTVYVLFKELTASLNIEPDLITWNTVINAFCQAGRFKEALLTLDEMERNGIKPDLVSYNTLMHTFYKNDRFEYGEEIWKMMEERMVCPSIVSYNSKLQVFASNEMMEEAVELVEELRTKGLQLDVHSYNVLIGGFCNVENLEEAMWWYGEMWKSNVLPNPVTVIVLITFLCRKGVFDAAFKICRDLMELSLIVDTEMIQIVVDGLVKESKVEEAAELVKLGKSVAHFSYELVLRDNE